MLTDLRRGVATGIMAARFHNALVEAIVAVAQAAGERQVALTGGCFQNRLLTERAAERLERAGFEVLLHRQVPPNDGGISLGQVVDCGGKTERRTMNVKCRMVGVHRSALCILHWGSSCVSVFPEKC